MSELFDLSNFDKYKEDNCREVKKAEGGLPIALWESYSSFANSNGGVIILGVGERQNGTWYTTGLKNADKFKRNFWNTIHDTKKVSINLLSDKNVESYEVDGDTILVIYVPRAKRDQKPVYINNDLFGGTYRRDWEGDYHCSKAEIKFVRYSFKSLNPSYRPEQSVTLFPKCMFKVSSAVIPARSRSRKHRILL